MAGITEWTGTVLTLEHVVCNLCKADHASAYCAVNDFQIVRCNVCGLLYTNPRRPESEIPNIYSEEYFVSQNPSTLGYDDYCSHAEGLKRLYTKHLALIEKYVRPPAAILDIGCAFGYFLEVASSRGWRPEGVEVSTYAAKQAERNAKATIYNGTLSSAHLPESFYDVATMWDVLEHTFDPTAQLVEVNRVLKPRGYLFMTVPNAGSSLARIMGTHWYGFKKVAEHNYFFSKDTLRRLLTQTGFALLQTSPGIWPCSLSFLVTKLEPYSPTAYRIARKIVNGLGLGNMIVNFRFIDMFVIARKQGDPLREPVSFG